MAAPSAVAVNDQLGSSLPFTGPPSANGAGPAVAIAPTARSARAVEAAVPSDTENLLWVMMLAVLAIPGFLLMALIATVLIRR